VIAAPKAPVGRAGVGTSARGSGKAQIAKPDAAVMARLNYYLSHP
jgi:hypothetical protein